MPRVFVAMIEFNAGTFQGVDKGGYDAFDDAAARASALFDAHATNPGDLRIFMAPEYYFSDVGTTSRGGITIGSMSSRDKLSIYKKVERTSSSYGNMLIVAGSIAYSKSSVFSSEKFLNVCPIAANGEILLKYYKQTNDAFQSTETDAFSTKNKGSTFTYRNVRFGIEICLDHSPRHKTLKTSVNGGLVDIHLLVSAGANTTRTAIAARSGGLAINCDLSGKGGGNGITPITGHTETGIATVASKNTAVVQTLPLGSGGQVTLYSGALA